MITQLIIYPPSGGAGIVLPEVRDGAFSCYPDLLSQQVEMISGRMVTEVRGTVYRVTADYGEYYLTMEFWQRLSAVLRSGLPFQADVLPDDAAEPVTSTFLVESLTPPSFRFGREGVPYWCGLQLTLREVSPHD